MSTPKIILMTAGQPIAATVVSNTMPPGTLAVQHEKWIVLLKDGEAPVVYAPGEAEMAAREIERRKHGG
jgi:hypothetical protein